MKHDKILLSVYLKQMLLYLKQIWMKKIRKLRQIVSSKSFIKKVSTSDKFGNLQKKINKFVRGVDCVVTKYFSSLFVCVVLRKITTCVYSSV